MYRWCAYCQQYQGEKAPFDDHSLTHGICTSCLASAHLGDEDALGRLQPIIEFMGAMRAMARTGHHVSVATVVQYGRGLGMRPIDLLVGILQPALYELGKLWEQGTIGPSVEASFSAFSDELLTELERQQVQGPTSVRSAPVVLLNARRNLHTLGLRVTAFLLRERGIAALAITPTPAVDELTARLRVLSPAVVGVSLATDWQLPFLDEVLAAVATLSPRPRVVAGGMAVIAGHALPVGVEAYTDLEGFVATVRRG